MLIALHPDISVLPYGHLLCGLAVLRSCGLAVLRSLPMYLAVRRKLLAFNQIIFRILS